jgi:hypothetical protein
MPGNNAGRTRREIMKYVHTFTFKGFVVAVIHRDDADKEAAAMSVSGKWDKVRCEAAEDLY